jgi:hypothetical protein
MIEKLSRCTNYFDTDAIPALDSVNMQRRSEKIQTIRLLQEHRP